MQIAWVSVRSEEILLYPHLGYTNYSDRQHHEDTGKKPVKSVVQTRKKQSFLAGILKRQEAPMARSLSPLLAIIRLVKTGSAE